MSMIFFDAVDQRMSLVFYLMRTMRGGGTNKGHLVGGIGGRRGSCLCGVGRAQTF